MDSSSTSAGGRILAAVKQSCLYLPVWKKSAVDLFTAPVPDVSAYN